MIVSDVDQNFGLGPWFPSGSVVMATDPIAHGQQPQEIFGRFQGSEDGIDWGFMSNVALQVGMLSFGASVAIWGIKGVSPFANILFRVTGGLFAGIALLKVLGVVGPCKCIKEPTYKVPSTPSADVFEGLGSEWYPDDRTDEYSNKFAAMLQSRYQYAGIPAPEYIEGLGQIEYHVKDEGGEVVIRSQCPPFMVGSGYTVDRAGPKGGTSGMGRYGSGGFWEVLGAGGQRVAAFRCRPFDVARWFTLKQVVRTATGAKEILRESQLRPGAAPYPPGTMRERRGSLFTTRRG